MQRKVPVRQRELALADTPELVRIEKNLLQWGFFSAAQATKNRDNPTSRRIEQWVMRDEKRVKVTAEFRASSLGLPRTPDRDKYLAFMHIAAEQKQRQGRITNPIEFGGARMLKLLGLTDAGKNYEELTQWGKRMADTTITSEQVFYFAARRKFVDDTIHVFRRFTVKGASDNKTTTQFGVYYSVVVEDWLLDNINESYYVPIDFNQYKKLAKPIAKGIFNYLYYWFFAIRSTHGSEVEKDYSDLCALLDIACHKRESKIREQLSPSLQELVKIGYVKKWNVRPMVSKEGWKLVIEPGANLIDFIRSHQRKELPGQVELNDQLSEAQGSVRTKLLDIGVDDKKALELCKKYDPETLLMQLEYIDEVVVEGPGRIKNVPGFAISFIENQKSVPKTFIPNDEKNRRAQEWEQLRKSEQQEKDAILAADIEKHQYKEWCEELALKHIGENFTKAALDNKLRQIEEHLFSDNDRDMSKAIARMPAKVKREVLMRQLAKAVIEEMDEVPSLSEWRKSHAQTSLFANRHDDL